MAKSNSDDDRKHKQAITPAVSGEGAISGSDVDLEADDDMLENAHEMGLYKADDGENPQELNIADQVLSAEKKRRGLD
ncbi:MAG TPA: hypothetical protein VJG66_02885 [Patescibacteria group bacterium]|nr:hypothetical protein [Patescibacteria group bacterium]